MSSPRETFLERVRHAVRAGNRAGVAAAIEPRGAVGYQGAGSDPAARFRDGLIAAGGQAYLVQDREAAIEQVLELVRRIAPRRILLGRGSFVDSLDMRGHVQELGCEITSVDQLSEDDCKDKLFAADLSITGVDYLIAETGSIVFLSRPEEPRSSSLLPPVHVAVASADQIVPDLFDLFEMDRLKQTEILPSCISVITGPSKTGDIELTLVTGVHGPGEIHVVLVAE